MPALAAAEGSLCHATTADNANIRRLEQTMAMAGWYVDFLDMDLTAAQPSVVMKCHRADGRWLWAKVDTLGRCSLETFQRKSYLGKPQNSKGRWPLSPQVDDLFLGRVHPAGPHALMREITNYIADNAMSPVALGDIRAAWAAFMASPAKLAPPAM